MTLPEATITIERIAYGGAGIGRLREQIRITKALDYVVSNATVTEVPEPAAAKS